MVNSAAGDEKLWVPSWLCNSQLADHREVTEVSGSSSVKWGHGDAFLKVKGDNYMAPWMPHTSWSHLEEAIASGGLEPFLTEPSLPLQPQESDCHMVGIQQVLLVESMILSFLCF